VLLEELWKHEIRIITQLDANYPEQLNLVLGEDAPPVLFVKGNLRALEKTGIGFCGSRKASEKGNQLVRSSSAIFAHRGLNVVSGYAHGVDLAAHIGSLESDGFTTFVLPLGILNFQLKSSINSLLTDDNYLVVSEFIPKLGWEVHNAMRRNLTICGLSKAIILVEPGITGGTFEAGKTALKYERPLFVVEHEAHLDSEGNKYFIQRGAKTLQENENGLLEIEPVIQSISSEALGIRQQSLF
ncbi:MAG TPA: DNA-processing protein DprA, partial [candidate division Zixibacteria bacterium]|nr:DNA-processing protein DprA [candidate division Zixibacteria bacterium]